MKGGNTRGVIVRQKEQGKGLTDWMTWMHPIRILKPTKIINPLEILGKVVDGAEGEIRTRTGLPPLDPEPSVSTSSTTSALEKRNEK